MKGERKFDKMLDMYLFASRILSPSSFCVSKDHPEHRPDGSGPSSQQKSIVVNRREQIR